MIHSSYIWKTRPSNVSFSSPVLVYIPELAVKFGNLVVDEDTHSEVSPSAVLRFPRII